MNICSDEVTMSSVQNLRELINERLTAAAEEIFTEFEKTIVQYEEEIDCQSRLLDNIWKPQITQHTADLTQQHVCKEELVLAEQKVCNQERNSSLEQEDPELIKIKEEQEELCSSLDGQQLVPDHETHVFMLIQCKSKCEQLSREIFRIFEKTVVQYEEKVDRQRRQLEIIRTPKMKLHSMDPPRQHVCIEEEVVTEQQFCNQEMNSNLDHEDSKPPWIKEEQEDICTSVFQDDIELVQIKEEQKELCTSVDMEEPDHPAIKEQEELCTSVDQEESELPQIKEEQDEVCTSQEGEQLVLKQEIDVFVMKIAS
ncbi:inner centromere protein A-like isoform X29 [Acanthochromis polyacanthus]|uniref:inner centromere protein A-like isoform X29 n=1 Tax=Acanthochromis polyacanthus TaxID=80966 RepID=UPI0022341CF5|nr:inner centromere protein A-like isoform X29 [Acanthochromis polyacanthus]